MKKCPYCAEEIQDEAIVCRYCGRDLKPAEPVSPVVQQPAVSKSIPNPTPEAARKSTVRALIIVGLLLVIFIAGVLLSVGNGGGSTAVSKPTATINPKAAAFVMCQEFVKDRLKAPATAKFASITDSKIETLIDNYQWRVTSYVDSQNGFGAMIRTNYVCRINNTGGDQWKLSDLTTE